jgi:hypothetical protein
MKASEFVAYIQDMIREYGDLPIVIQEPWNLNKVWNKISVTFPYYTGSGPTYFIVVPDYIQDADNKDQYDGS